MQTIDAEANMQMDEELVSSEDEREQVEEEKQKFETTFTFT